MYIYIYIFTFIYVDIYVQSLGKTHIFWELQDKQSSFYEGTFLNQKSIHHFSVSAGPDT